MVLDLAAFEAAFPAALILAVATTPNGLVTAATQVYVARARRSGDVRTTTEAWLRPLDSVEGEAGLGHDRLIARYELEVSKDDMTLAQQRSLRDQIYAYFNGYARPATTGLFHVRVVDPITDLHDEEGPTGAVTLVLELHPR